MDDQQAKTADEIGLIEQDARQMSPEQLAEAARAAAEDIADDQATDDAVTDIRSRLAGVYADELAAGDDVNAARASEPEPQELPKCPHGYFAYEPCQQCFETVLKSSLATGQLDPFALSGIVLSSAVAQLAVTKMPRLEHKIALGHATAGLAHALVAKAQLELMQRQIQASTEKKIVLPNDIRVR